MDPCLVVSPHLDDAILSAGQFLAQWPGAHVLTVFAGTPPPEMALTTYDNDSGHRSGHEAMERRRREDRDACAVVGSEPHHLGFCDHQYREGEPPDMTGIAAEVRAALVRTQATRLLFPLGLCHPDHRAVADACLGVVGEDGDGGLEAFAYEELPYRVLSPEAVTERLATLGDDGWKTALEFIGEGQLRLKQRAVRTYASQLWALDLRCCWVPERFWRLTR